MSLPDGFTVRLRDDLHAVDHGRTLLGGSPLRLLRLSAAAAGLVEDHRVVVRDRTTGRLADRLLAADVALPESTGEEPDVPLTVVIPVRDRVEELDVVLGGLGGALPVIVVDDGSLDPDEVEAAATRHGARCIRLPTNRGPAAARNAGLAQVETPLVAFVDSDIRVAPEDLRTLTRHFSDPSVVLAGPRVRGDSPSGHRPVHRDRRRPALGAGPRVRGDSPRGRWHLRYDAAASSLDVGPRSGLVRPGTAVAWMPSACLVGRAASLRPGFDAGLRVGEDVDLVWRLVRAGHRVRYDASITVRHRTPPELRRWLARKVAYGSSAAPLALRHGTAVAPAAMTPTVALAAAAILAGRRWSPAVAGALMIPTLWRLRRTLPSSGSTTPLRITVRSLAWGVRQQSSLLLRHWWPLTAVALLRSARVRRAVLLAVLVDTAAAKHDRSELDAIGMTLGRRLDDLAYGIGLWRGCVDAGSLTALVPLLARARRRDDR